MSVMNYDFLFSCNNWHITTSIFWGFLTGEVNPSGGVFVFFIFWVYILWDVYVFAFWHLTLASSLYKQTRPYLAPFLLNGMGRLGWLLHPFIVNTLYLNF